MSKLPFPKQSVVAGTAPLFHGSIVAPDTGEALTSLQCYKITLNVVLEKEFDHELVEVPHYSDVSVSLDCLKTTSEDCDFYPNFWHRCEVYDESGNPHSAFHEIGRHYRVEYAFYWRDAEGREKLPVKIVEIVNVI